MGVSRVKRLLAMLLAMMMLFPNTAMAAKSKGFRLLTTPENELLVKYVEDYCRQSSVDLSVTYMGDIDAINELSINSDRYDAVWLSNSMRLYRLDQSVSITDSKSTGIVPIIVGIKPELYSESIKTMDQAKNQETRDQVYSYMKENSEIYSTYVDLIQLVKAGENDYYYGYESEFIRLNMEYGTTLKLIYLEDGVPLADKPFAYIDNKDSRKKEIFLEIQNYLLKNSTQKRMCQDGIRTGYGGQVPYAEQNVFNVDWGIETQKYLAPMNYPSKEVTTEFEAAEANKSSQQISDSINKSMIQTAEMLKDTSLKVAAAGERSVIDESTIQSINKSLVDTIAGVYEISKRAQQERADKEKRLLSYEAELKNVLVIK